MLIYLIRKNEIIDLRLPVQIQGNYWLSYININGENTNLVNIEASNDRWIVRGNVEASLYYNDMHQPSIELKLYELYKVQTKNENMYIFVMPSFEPSFGRYEIEQIKEITIGKGLNNSVIYGSSSLSEIHAKITLNNGVWIVENLDNQFGVYINKTRMNKKILTPGDNIFIMGLKIVFMGTFLVINNPNNLVSLNGMVFGTKKLLPVSKTSLKEDPYLTVYKDEDYFEKSPRFITEFTKKTVKIDAPPDKQNEMETPLLYTVGPMMTMGMTSMVTGWSALNGILNGGKSVNDSLPQLITSFAMIMTMLFWPLLSKRFQMKQNKKKEKLRQEKYKKYLFSKNEEIKTLMNQEKQVLIDNNVSLEECQNIIIKRNRKLWEKEIYQDDFLTVRLGVGEIKPNIEIIYPEEHFSLSEDNLKQLLKDSINENELISNVPVRISLATKNFSAIIGERNLTDNFLESLLIQIMTFQSYRDLKIVFLTSKNNKKFSYLKQAPHIFNDNKTFRFYGEDTDEIKEISDYLNNVFNSRRYFEGKESELDYKNYAPYYFIIVDDLNVIKNAHVLKELLSAKTNYGFSIIFRSNSLSSLPKECSMFINISGEQGKNSGYFENELTTEKQQLFVADLNVGGRVNMQNIVSVLSRIPLRANDAAKQLPKVLSFLEMFDVGKVEQLNCLHRWTDNNPTITLSVPVGVDETGELFKLDLHEKKHGPHGLVAGMTGSGKSEFIITYILSLAVNYHPNEVSFVLIDYKGGGLAGAFENRETGICLPHLAGTITNLDTIEMNRALASIRSELRRRQRLFNEARDKLGESTVDIYKYQRLYREKQVNQPISHLFIISDEFAELKTQQPEFMKELISTARIGRSLGVHLILATQKPSGVVDDQIWSNSKFRICLKVQDKADSKDMIGCPDAASLVDVGRFYLQVGYNEYFALGQSAYCGSPYYPMEKRQKKVDNSVNFIDNIGNIIKTANDNTQINGVKAQGEELATIIKYLINLANSQSIKIDRLWLNKIPEIIFIDDLRKKYNYQPKRNIINPIIGEFDDPNNQRQGLLTLPLSEDGNTIIYGIAGSGKEDLLSAMIYSTICDHDASEVNFYILDFGSELLGIFKDAPQVGDFVVSSKQEKITNLFKMLNSVIDTRKIQLLKYNGDFKLYNEKETEKLPTIVVIINNYEAFLETYEAENETLVVLARECFKYGIVLVLTASAANSVRYKLSQNFKTLIPLQLNDEFDYTTIVGKTNGVYPSELVGRGLVKLDEVYEFQTALAKEKSAQTEFIKAFCLKLKEATKYMAREIPVLPEHVTLELILPKLKGNDIPVGIYKDNLEIATYNFKNSYASVISSMDPDAFGSFVKPLVCGLSKVSRVIVLDTNNIIEKSSNIEYYSNKFDGIINSLDKIITKNNEIFVKNNYDIETLKDEEEMTIVISGIGNFYNRLESDNKKTFEKMLTSGIDTKKVKFIFIDTADQFKNFEYSDWYKSAITKNGGIWIGNGLADQTILKISKMPKTAKTEIPNNYGYVVNRGMAKLVKFVEGDKDGQ